MKYIMQNRIGEYTSGFTLVETLVSVAILLLVIVGPMTIASRGMQSAYFAGDQTTATYLAQEAIEHIQSLRDDNVLQEHTLYTASGSHGGDTWSWYDALNANCKDDDGCDYNFANDTYRDCTTAGSCRLNKNATSTSGAKIYAYTTGTGWSSAPYTRRIRIGTPISVAGEDIAVPVTVTVQWATNLFTGNLRTITLQTYLYDHYTRFE
jgi:type II secretory pathway pseudopilin PulG